MTEKFQETAFIIAKSKKEYLYHPKVPKFASIIKTFWSDKRNLFVSLLGMSIMGNSGIPVEPNQEAIIRLQARYRNADSQLINLLAVNMFKTVSSDFLVIRKAICSVLFFPFGVILRYANELHGYFLVGNWNIQILYMYETVFHHTVNVFNIYDQYMNFFTTYRCLIKG